MSSRETRGRVRATAIAVMLITTAIAGLTFAPASPAQAPAPTESPTPLPTLPSEQSVTLEASKTTVNYGKSTTLKGVVSSGEANETVTILDENQTEIAETSTIDNGQYFIAFAPKSNMTVHAQWESVSSDPVALKVSARAHVRLGDVRLFGEARVTGSVKPGRRGERATVGLRRSGKVVKHKSVKTNARGKFSTKFPIDKPGAYSAKVSYKPQDLLPAKGVSPRRKTPLPSLTIGSTGTSVRLLEGRLKELNYYLTGRDHYYDARTADAVRAFNKVQGRPRVGDVNAGTWRALVSPKRPRARVRTGDVHIEVDQTRQVFYTVKAGNITNILHVSTGANNATRDGHFRIYRKGGAGREFYPSYFDGARAFHVWGDVPWYGASHGCIRLPYWTRTWYWRATPIGIRVHIYH